MGLEFPAMGQMGLEFLAGQLMPRPLPPGRGVWYDAEHTATEFAARLQDTVDPDSVRADLAGVVHAVLEPAHVSVWLRQ
jgi:hypothetical protein